VSPIPPSKPLPSEITARLESVGVWQMVNAAYYGVFVRNGCMVVAQRNPDTGEYTSMGSAGYSVEGIGVAFLQWKDDTPYLYRKDFDPVPATPEQLETLRQFSSDVKNALGLES
jgi:hypothetical protein